MEGNVFSRKIRKALVIGVLVFALPLTQAADCKGGETPGVGTQPGHDPVPDKRVERPGCPDITFRADDERCLVLQTFVESRLGPYDVYITITGGNGAYPKHIPVSSGGWKHSLVYRTGVKMMVKVTLHYEGNPSKEGFCSITDADELVKAKLTSITAGGGSPYNAGCILTTKQ